MQIWIDADACPKVIQAILFRAAERTGTNVILVANKPLRIPPSPRIETIQVAGGFDEADNYICREMQPGDLVITADIPLAAEAIAKGGHALNPRGEFYNTDNIHERLAVRNLLDELRGSGTVSGGPPAFSHSDRQAFANQLDQFLTKYAKQ